MPIEPRQPRLSRAARFAGLALVVAVTADVVSTLLGFRRGAREATPGYRALPKWAVLVTRTALAVAGLVGLYFVARLGGAWTTAAIVVCIAGAAVATVAAIHNHRVARGRAGREVAPLGVSKRSRLL